MEVFAGWVIGLVEPAPSDGVATKGLLSFGAGYIVELLNRSRVRPRCNDLTMQRSTPLPKFVFFGADSRFFLPVLNNKNQKIFREL